MGRIRAMATECNYKELDEQLKEQIIHGLNESDMLAEIIRQLAKTDENTLVTCETNISVGKKN